MKNSLPDVGRLNELFDYEPETGRLLWKVRAKGVNKDRIAGCKSHGYIVVRVDDVLYQAHRLIWKIMTGNDPVDQIDHRDLNRANNRWVNLREADNSQNMMNAGLSRQNTSGIKGVFWDTHANAWRARIKINKKSHHIGIFAEIEQAATAIKAARDRFHGDFARAA